MNLNIFVFLAFIVFLGGCAHFKKKHPVCNTFRSIDLKRSTGQVATDCNFTRGEWPQKNWWERFEDDQLNRLMHEAIDRNFDLKAAAMRVKSSEQEAIRVGLTLFPLFQWRMRDNYQFLSKNGMFRSFSPLIPAVINQIDFKLNFDHELDLFGKNRAAYQAAVYEARAQNAEMSQALLMITSALAKAYFDYQATLLRIDAQKEILEIRKLITKRIEKRAFSQIDDRIILERTKIDLAEAKEGLEALEKNLDLTKSQLKILLGLSPDYEKKFDEPSAHFDQPFPLPQNLSIHLLARRPDLMMRICRVEAAAELIKVAHADFFPNINLSAFAGLESLKWSKLFSSDSLTAASAPTLSLPFFRTRQLKARFAKFSFDFEAAVSDYNAHVLRAAKEVSGGVKYLQVANRCLESQTEVLKRIKRVRDLTRDRYENGISSYLELMQIDLEVLYQYIRAIDFQQSRHLALITLICSLGGGYEQQESEVASDE